MSVIVPEVPLTAGSKTIQVGFGNDYHDHENDRDRNLHVDRLTLRDSTGTVVSHIELESLGRDHCRGPEGHFDGYQTFWCNVDVSLAVEIYKDDVYQVEVVAHQDRVGDEPARMTVVVESDDGVSAGAAAIRTKLMDLHRTLFGIDVALDSPDVNEAFNVFFEVWARKRRTEGSHFNDPVFQCHPRDFAYYEGLVTDPPEFNEHGWAEWNRERVDELYENADMSDPVHAVRVWVVTLAYLMTDYRYLYF